MQIDSRRINQIAVEAATPSRSVVVEVQALAVTEPSPHSNGVLYEWAAQVSIDPIVAVAEGLNLHAVVVEVFGAAFEALRK